MFATIRAEVAAGLNGWAFTDGRALRVAAYIPDQIVTPAAVFDFEVGGPLTLGNTSRDVDMIVTVFDQRDSERASQARLDEARDHTTGGLIDTLTELTVTGVDYIRYQGCSRVQVVESAGVPLLAVELRFALVF